MRIDVSQDQVLARDTTISLPLVSVLMPVYNGEQFIAQAIESALAQTLRNIEVIVVDDGSSDASGAIADRYAAEHPKRVRVVHQANAGLPLARNAAMRAEREAIDQALAKFRWNRRKAAAYLKVSYKTLLNKMKECGISEPGTA